MTTSPELIASQLIDDLKKKAQEVGFHLFGLVDLDDPLHQDALDLQSERYERYIKAQLHGSMAYLARHQEVKAHPERLIPDPHSLIMVAESYIGPKDLQNRGSISWYAQEQDYHVRISSKLEELKKLLDPWGQSFLFVDTAAVAERFWAWRAGLGWVGKNTCLISRKMGSYFYLGGILTQVRLKDYKNEPTASILTDHCGKCRRCIDACPTEALQEGRLLDSTRCLSYHTIENRNLIPEEIQKKVSGYIFGCDICQIVCPWNQKFSLKGINSASWHGWSLSQLASLSRAEFKNVFQNTALSRLRYWMYLRNIMIAARNTVESNQVMAAVRAHFDHLSDEEKAKLVSWLPQS